MGTTGLLSAQAPLMIIFQKSGPGLQCVKPDGEMERVLQKVGENGEHIQTEGGHATTVLAALSLCIFAVFCLRHRIRKWLPSWLRPFAEEEDHSRSLRPTKLWTVWTLCLGLLSFSGLFFSIVPLRMAPSPERMLDTIPWCLISLMTAFKRPVKASRLLFLQYLVMLLSTLGLYSNHFLNRSSQPFDPFLLFRTIIAVIGVIIIGNMPLRNPSWDVAEIGHVHQPPSYHVRSPEDNLTFFQFWTMSWVFPLAKITQERELDVEDVWQLPFAFQHKHLYLAFRDLQGRLIPRLLEANGFDLFVSASLAVAEKVLEISNIRLTSKLYNALDGDDPKEALFWCLFMLGMDVSRQICKTTANWYSRKAYERSRGETFIGLFSKLLTRAVPGSDKTERGPEEDTSSPLNGAHERRLGLCGWMSKFCETRKKSTPSLSARPSHNQPASNAKVVNLVRSDTYEISQRFWDFSRLVSQPVKVVITMYYLIDLMGWTCCIGFGLMAVTITTNSFLVREYIKLERDRRVHSDKRAQAVSHFVEASRALKVNGWTDTWSRRILRFREAEMMKRLKISYLGSCMAIINIIGGAAYPLASICLYTLVLRRGLPNKVIWPALQLFSHLESSVKDAFQLISAYWKTAIPVERVNKYLDEPDRGDESSSRSDTDDIKFENASFSWPSSENFVLEDITLSFPMGLTIIRGPVGAGKSSLLLAALNEMQLRQGRLLRPDEAIAYAQQLPWLQNKTIQENIIFHQPFDQTRYLQVLHACALNTDLENLEHGDQQKLEEGGVGLSGGQKARVALARALYSRCRILVLDDPLAALDHDTASKIVKRCFQGPLAQGRTIVLSTHRDELVLRIATQVIDIEDGRAKVRCPDDIKQELEDPFHALLSDTTALDVSDQPQQAQVEEVKVLKEAPEEASKTGTVPFSVYTKYMSSGGIYLWYALAASYGVSRYCDISRARLLEAWGNETAATLDIEATGYWGLPNPQAHPGAWLWVLSGLSGAQIVAYAVAQVILAHICVNAAQGLFKKALYRVGMATFLYYDTTSTAQLKNRLVSDMGMIDGGILGPLESFVFYIIALLLSLVAITTHQPMLLIILFVAALVYVGLFRIYVPISRCLRRMEMRYLTPIISNIGVMQDGLITIRALRVEGHFQDRHLEAVDDFQKQDHFYWSMQYWLDFRTTMSSACMRALLVSFMMLHGTPASAVGFVLTQTTIAMSSIQQLCERIAQLQLDAVSLERVEMLGEIPQEASGDEDPPEDWPSPSDNVEFFGMSFKYSDEGRKILDDVTFSIPGGSTCAVLGRTGSGKSTVANALLATRTAEQGVVRIGNVDLAKVKRKVLRNRITFIQQDPILFPGSLRDNIDPEGKFSDEECNNAIHRVLGPHKDLDFQVDAAGKNLSQGQRQLVSIGRAILRRSGLVILDEATASIDRAMAARVQRILREELANSTVITIAHRLEAVEDANWCLKLEHGRVKSCGPTGRACEESVVSTGGDTTSSGSEGAGRDRDDSRDTSETDEGAGTGTESLELEQLKTTCTGVET